MSQTAHVSHVSTVIPPPIPENNAFIPVSQGAIGSFQTLTVDARALHAALGVKRDFSTWIKGRIGKFGFANGHDYEKIVNYSSSPNLVSLPDNGFQTTDYRLTLDMAKELCMVENNEKGKLTRRYFIECERRALEEPKVTLPDFTNPVLAARAWADAQEARQLAERQALALEQQAVIDRPKVIFADAVDAAKTSILIGDFAKILRQNGVEMGQTRLFDWLRNNGWLIRQKGLAWNSPTQKSMERGFFEQKERTINNPDGTIRITKTTLMTGKGQVYFVNRFLNGGEVAQ